jgi:hypothetical protein
LRREQRSAEAANAICLENDLGNLDIGAMEEVQSKKGVGRDGVEQEGFELRSTEVNKPNYQKQKQRFVHRQRCSLRIGHIIRQQPVIKDLELF